MANKVFINKQGVIQWRDLLKSIVPALVVPVLFILQDWATSTVAYQLDWNVVLKAAVSGAVTYLIQQMASPAKVITTYDSNAEAKAVAESITPVKQ